jgi:hypothetical protein
MPKTMGKNADQSISLIFLFSFLLILPGRLHNINQQIVMARLQRVMTHCNDTVYTDLFTNKSHVN